MKRTEVKSGSLFNIILVSALAFVMLGTVIYSLDRRNTMYSKVSSLNNELELAEAENVRLQSELESKMSAKNVEDYAENELGMKKIDSSQIKYIEIQTDDVVSIPKQNEGVLAKVREIFDRCVEYFRG
jgi:cell division protein FtsL